MKILVTDNPKNDPKVINIEGEIAVVRQRRASYITCASASLYFIIEFDPEETVYLAASFGLSIADLEAMAGEDDQRELH